MGIQTFNIPVVHTGESKSTGETDGERPHLWLRRTKKDKDGSLGTVESDERLCVFHEVTSRPTLDRRRLGCRVFTLTQVRPLLDHPSWKLILLYPTFPRPSMWRRDEEGDRPTGFRDRPLLVDRHRWHSTLRHRSNHDVVKHKRR